MSSIDARRSVYLTLLYCYSIDDLAARQHSLNTQRVMMELPQMLHVVQQDIMVCHNNIDTYYKEHRLGTSMSDMLCSPSGQYTSSAKQCLLSEIL